MTPEKQMAENDDIPFNRNFPLKPGVVEEVRPGVRRVLCDNPSPFTFTGTVSYIVGKDKVALIDPGPDSEAHAKALLDAVRARVGLPSVPVSMSAIKDERRKELAGEGHRWFDLRRTGRALSVLSPIKPGLTATDLWYPLPLDAIKTNPFLVQNDGYK